MSATITPIRSGLTFCHGWLSEVRAAARGADFWVDDHATVTRLSADHEPAFFRVTDHTGRIVWDGRAHCTLCARSEAIAARAGGAR